MMRRILNQNIQTPITPPTPTPTTPPTTPPTTNNSNSIFSRKIIQKLNDSQNDLTLITKNHPGVFFFNSATNQEYLIGNRTHSSLMKNHHNVIKIVQDNKEFNILPCRPTLVNPEIRSTYWDNSKMPDFFLQGIEQKVFFFKYYTELSLGARRRLQYAIDIKNKELALQDLLISAKNREQSLQTEKIRHQEIIQTKLITKKLNKEDYRLLLEKLIQSKTEQKKSIIYEELIKQKIINSKKLLESSIELEKRCLSNIQDYDDQVLLAKKDLDEYNINFVKKFKPTEIN